MKSLNYDLSILRIYEPHEAASNGYPRSWKYITAHMVEVDKACAHCGYDGTSNVIIKRTLHHKNKYALLDCRPENLIMLCWECHKQEQKAMWRFHREFLKLSHHVPELYDVWRSFDLVKPKEFTRFTNSHASKLYRIYMHILEREPYAKLDAARALQHAMIVMSVDKGFTAKSTFMLRFMKHERKRQNDL